MNKRIRKAIQESFAAPPATGKAEFFKSLRFPRNTYWDVLLSQFHYIRKRVWIVSIIMVVIGGAAAVLSPELLHWNTEAGKIWVTSAILPFLALITVTEIYRSLACRMAELEASFRFSLSQIMMARITVLGSVNSVILILLLVMMNRITDYSLFRVLAYMIVPYLVVCSLCLWILNHVRGQEGVYGCSAAACLVGTASIFINSCVPLVFTKEYVTGWILLAAACFVFIGVQIFKLFKQMEDGTWNLFWTE